MRYFKCFRIITSVDANLYLYKCENVHREGVDHSRLHDYHTGNDIAKGELEAACRVGVCDIWMHIRVAESDISFLKTVLMFSTKYKREFDSVGVEGNWRNWDSL